MPFRTRAPFLVLASLYFLALAADAHSPAEEMSAAASNFTASLTLQQRAKAVFEFKNDERFDWHFIPKSRKGLPFGEMTTPQRLLAHALLCSGLSQRGFMKATTIMSLEQILYDMEDKAPHRDADLYYVTIFGLPGKEAWGWRVEGHHLSLNFAVEGEQVLSVTPSFFGANPAQIQTGPRKGLRVLGFEEDLARQFLAALSDEQRKVAILTNTAPRDIITGNGRTARPLEPMGISSSSLNAAQKQLLENLLAEYVQRYRPEISQAELKQIHDAGDIFFAWAGGTDPGFGHYYRIQGPTFLMEYDNTQDKANHIHTVWRNLKNDFGEDLLRKHYEQVPHGK